MRRASGVILILAGTGIGAYGVTLGTEVSDQELLTRQDDMAKAHSAGSHIASMVVARKTIYETVSLVTVSKAHRAEPGRTPLLKMARIPKDRESLVHELQKELRRVGCYNGPMSGVWTPSVRKAMKDFTNHVNAMLPTAQPDTILLALVQSHQDKACGKLCSVGQEKIDDGRCLASASLVRSGNASATALWKQRPEETTPAATAQRTEAPAPETSRSSHIGKDRMGLAGPTKVEQAQKKASAAKNVNRRARKRGGPMRFEQRMPSIRAYERRGSGFVQQARGHYADRVFRGGISNY